MDGFTPVSTTLGALLLHISTSLLLLKNSQILGASSLLGSPLSHKNLPIVSGMLLPAVLLRLVNISSLTPIYIDRPAYVYALAGVLVGFGTKARPTPSLPHPPFHTLPPSSPLPDRQTANKPMQLANGCTSGHMLCGVPRLSYRSLAATVTFFSIAVATTSLLNTAPACGNGSIACTRASYPAASVAAAQSALVVLGAAAAMLVPAQSTAAATLAGALFGAGLLVSGMAAPAKPLRFLALANSAVWDPSLALVAVFGVGANWALWTWWGRANSGQGGDAGRGGVGGSNHELPDPKRPVDGSLLVGAALFGVGWGIAGVCPGPGILAAVLAGWKGAVWIGAFWAGRYAADVGSVARTRGAMHIENQRRIVRLQ